MARLSFGDFLNQVGPSEGRGRGRGRGGGRGGGGRGGGGRGGRGGGRGGGGGYGDSSRGRGGTRSVRGGHFGADYSSVPLDYSQYTKATYHRFEPPVQPFAPDPSRESDRGRGRGRGGGVHGGGGTRGGRGRGAGPRGGVGFTPGGASTPGSGPTTSVPSSVPGSGAATPITGGLGYHVHAPERRTAARTVDGVVTWGGGRAPLFVKAGELFRDGEVDVVKRDGDEVVVETFPLSDPSAPQMRDLADDAEVEIPAQTDANELAAALGAVAAADPAAAAPLAVAQAELVEHVSEPLQPDTEDTSPADREDVEALLSEHMETALVVGDNGVVLEQAQDVVYSPSAPAVELENEVPLQAEEPVRVHEVQTTEEIVIDTSVSAPVEAPSDLAPKDTPVDNDGDMSPLDTQSGTDSAADDAALFFVDTAGDDPDTGDAATADALVYDAPAFQRAATPPAQEEEDESIVYRPRLVDDPWAVTNVPSSSGWTLGKQSGIYIDPRVTMGRKARKAAKKEAKRDKRGRSKRTRRKDGRAGLGGGMQPQDLEGAEGSDLDWGSDVPAVLGVVGADHDIGDEELDPDLDDGALERFGAGLARIRKDNDAMAYMPSDSDEYDDDDVAATRAALAETKASKASSGSSNDDDDDDETTDGDFSRLADAYGDEHTDDDEHAEDGEARMFTGKNQWSDGDEEEDEEDDGEAERRDEEDWFVQSMESALDGGAMSASRRERNRVFRAVANGSFDDALPIAPATKPNKKGTHLPLELQEQWQRDRAKKAEKKRERELQRALAILDPTSKFGKKARKGKGGAASIAHLIPGSAAEVADLFDVDGNDGGWGAEAPRRRNPLLPPTLADVDGMVQEFMSDSGRTTLPLLPMDKEGRKKVHMLAECYGLKSKSKGTGASRFPILIKLARSGLRNPDMRDRIVAAGGEKGTGFYKALYTRQRERPPRGTGASARARDGELVGEGADKIGEDNVGHRLLSKMGWSEGVSIGRAGGLDAPIVAVVKNTKRGLGS